MCCAGSRLLLQENVAEEVLHKLKNRVEKIRVGDPMDKNTDVGAINSKEQLAKITELAAAEMPTRCVNPSRSRCPRTSQMGCY